MESQVDLREELKQLETKVSIVTLIQSYNQSIDKRKQLLSNAQVCLYLDYLNQIIFQ